ncbi:YiiD C-terminal domain-containing protein [Mycobacterium sp. ACS4331]|uniref:YiiD C-terminal domain-containing protein n=1 Tax=Mycobacterium sp. ACS4331 TaxID=1834121 RepID=UPI000B0215C7
MTESVIDQMNSRMATTIPAAHQMGVRAAESRRGFAAATVPVEGNGNHFGVVYAGVVFTVAEILGGMLALSSFDATRFFPLVKGVDIRFLGMATTDLRAEASLDEDTIVAVQAEADEKGKADYIVEAVVTDAGGNVVAKTHGQYQIRRHPS